MYGIIYGAGLLISIVILLRLYCVRDVEFAKLLMLSTILVAFWNLSEALGYVIKIYEVIVFLQKAKFISAIIIPPVYFVLAMEYSIRQGKSLYLRLFIFLVPILSLLSLITNRFPYQFFSGIEVGYHNKMLYFTFLPEIGYIIHGYYSYAIVILGCCIFMIKAIKSPKLYRHQSIFIIVGTFLSFGMNLMVISHLFGAKYPDTTPISLTATLFILYWGIFHMQKSIMIPMARDLLVDNIKDITIILDGTDRIIDLNPAAVEFIKTNGTKSSGNDIISRLKLNGLRLNDLFEALPDLEQINSLQNNEDTITFHLFQKVRYFRVYQSPIYDYDKTQIGRLFMLHDITQLQEYTNSLKHLNEELEISDRIIDSATEGIVITDSNNSIIRVNKSVEEMSGYRKEDLIGKNPRVLKSDYHDREFYKDMWGDLVKCGYWEGEIWDRRKSGEVYPKWMTINSLKRADGSIQNFIAISTDISKIKKAEEDIKSLAYYDSITGIPNRNLFYSKLNEALIRANDNNKGVALLFMDLDDFKLINDSLGHAVGDNLLKEVAQRIKSNIRQSDIISRFGGDEFVLILENISKHEDAIPIAVTLIELVRQPFRILDREISLSISIGIALAPFDEGTVEGLVRKADAALYDAKKEGKGRYSFSSEQIEKRNHEALEMHIKLKNALENNEFKLYLQPQIGFDEGHFIIVGAEALIRWKTIDGSIFTPDKFIPMAESNGMIIPIGNWIIDEIFSIDKELKNNGIDIKLSINASSKQFENKSLVSKIKEVFDKSIQQNIKLTIEITESLLLQNLDKAIESLKEIKNLGIGISLDDFGTGFSSLSYLTRLPIDYLKIDKSFIDDIADPTRKNVTPDIISMAKTLDLKTVAEGVETKEQVQRLMEENCDELQGYYFSRPLDLNSFIDFVKTFSMKF